MAVYVIGSKSGVGQLNVGEIEIVGVEYSSHVLSDGVGEGVLRADFTPLRLFEAVTATLHLDDSRAVELHLHHLSPDEWRAYATTVGPVPRFHL
jgi:hypothetical protein